MPVVYAYNPSCTGGTDQEDSGSKPALRKKKKKKKSPSQKRAGGVPA
jgi:hypothetical protein